jgi:hypothetical protein
MDLVVVACLLSAPTSCAPVVLEVSPAPGISATVCMLAAQPMLAEWSVENPDRFVVSWRCAPSQTASAR